MNLNSLFRKKTVEQILKKVKEENEASEHAGLSKHLGVKDLTAFGIAAIIGAGIFSTIGQASFDGGPGVIFLFLFSTRQYQPCLFFPLHYLYLLPTK